MEVSLEKVKDIAKTLPVGYYIGREVKVEIDTESPASMYDVMGDRIFISFSQLSKALEKCEDDSTLENDIRTFLYHELSHAMITPTELVKNYKLHRDNLRDVMNIFEDERIETLLRGYYYGVDFKSMVYRLNWEDGMGSKSPIEMFFDVVRFRKGRQDFVDRVGRIIRKYKSLTRTSGDRTEYKYDYSSNGILTKTIHDLGFGDYIDDVISLYKDIEKEFKNNNSRSNSTSSQDGSSGTSDSCDTESGQGMGGKSNSENSPVKSDEELSEVTDKIDECPSEIVDTNGSYSKTVYDNRIKSQGSTKYSKGDFDFITNKYYNPSLTTELERIFSQSAKIKKMNGSAMNAYSGVFDPRSAGREDCRFFVQKNRNGNQKAFSKVHLNLFLDRSGSFEDNVQKANEILYSLALIEKKYPDFDFTLITCGIGETIEPTKNREHRAYDGTQISSEIFETFKKVQRRDATNFNIVLYDGSAWLSCNSMHWRREKDYGKQEYFAAFNTPNTLIITDPSNEVPVRVYCKSAKVVISKKYTEELIDNLLKMLEVLTR